jgi:hypothetical protein
MKHRNKRVVLELHPIDTHKIFGAEWFISNKYDRKAKGAKGAKWRKWALYLKSLTDNLRMKSRTMRFLTFLNFCRHTHSEVGCPYHNSTKLDHSLLELNHYIITNTRNL